jgi:hypothetical protein
MPPAIVVPPELPTAFLEFVNAVVEVVGLECDLVATRLAPPQKTFGVFFECHYDLLSTNPNFFM